MSQRSSYFDFNKAKKVKVKRLKNSDNLLIFKFKIFF